MPAKRLPMHKISDVLRLHFEGQFSFRQIARSLSMSHPAVSRTVRRALNAGVTADTFKSLSVRELEEQLYGVRPTPVVQRPEPDWALVKTALARPHVTRRLLWEEYAGANENALRYSQFCTRYREWLSHADPYMRLDHKAGERLYVDWSGKKAPVTNRDTGEVREAELFVAVLGASSYLYVEATWTQSLEDWIGAHVRALSFYGGVPELIVPDNTKTAVGKACPYSPTLNRTYADMATHYGTAILPTRTGSPQDKAKVEAAVQHVQRRILARLRNHTFFSLAALNVAIMELVTEINAAPFQKLPGSRESHFETIDRPKLKALPADAYEYATWSIKRAGGNYHVQVHKHFYSVPFKLTSRKLEVRTSARTVEIFYRGERVASHVRSREAHAYTTLAAHMPPGHRAYVNWTPQHVMAWATSVGPSTRLVCEHHLRTAAHETIACTTCRGLYMLGKSYGLERLEAACHRGATAGAFGLRSMRSILARGLDALPLAETTAQELMLPHHEHIRGPKYYN